ncbi:MAG: DUF4091 domain-containing protein [Kiritimatiellaeota bacterium]|nr:DUF4091 domain-containing protein [Kiritimatiellota bacterium]
MKMIRRVSAAAILAPAVFVGAVPRVHAIAVPNPSFEQGTGAAPDGWKLESGKGEWLKTATAPDGRRVLTVVGNGRDSGYWRSAPVAFRPNTVYEIRFMARGGSGGGTPTTGPIFCNRDLGGIPAEWKKYSSVFVTPAEVSAANAWLRFGQWHVSGAVAYDDLHLTRVLPVYRSADGLVLGEGESVSGRTYRFDAPLSGTSRNQSRPLFSQQCGFNTNRWVFGAGATVVYRHQLGTRRQTRARGEVSINWYSGGKLVVELSRDGKTWRPAAEAVAMGTVSFQVPPAWLPASAIWVRFAARSKAKVGAAFDPGSFQINSYRYTATVDGPAVEVVGATHFVTVAAEDPRVDIGVLGFGDGIPGGSNVVRLRLKSRGPGRLAVTPRAAFVGPAMTWTDSGPRRMLEPNRSVDVSLPYRVLEPGRIEMTLALGAGLRTRLRTLLSVPRLYDVSYGESLPGSSKQVALWWALSGWKISVSRPAPTAKGQALRVRAARNETDAAQLVVRPSRELRGFRARALAPLRGPEGAVLPPSAVEFLRVRYVRVERPTDFRGCVGLWPDPLPPLRAPISLPARRNQPLWVRVSVPKAARPGVYRGSLRLEADDWQADVPIEVTVFDFVLPDRMTCSTAFGFSPGNVWRYHNVKTPEQRRAVLDLYWANYSAHHISPYDPAPLDPYVVRWPDTGKWSGGIRDRTVRADGRGSLRLEDKSATANVACRYQDRFDIPAKGFRLRFRYRTTPADHRFIVTLNHHDARGQWMSGHNNDIRVQGSGDWRRFDRTLTHFPKGAKSATLTLWATLYAEDGHFTGTVWYDDVSLVDLSTGKELLSGGGFEPRSPEQLKPVFDWAAWDRAMDRAVNRYHFNSFRVRPMGLGGGTFYARRAPSLLGYAEGAPEYRTAFYGYWHNLQEHLRKRGLLDEAYVYWFDEPSPKDYAFVMNGFRKLKETAPDLRRMLTEQVEPDLVGGPNLWCPVLHSFQPERAAERQKQGDRFWWYVCTGPKAPYPGLFIDHAGTDLRVWLWLTWKYRVEGILVWQTNYWTSNAAYPDPAHPQDPYLDPMGWVSGYGTPAGTKRPWGNGDGRFIYPPESASDANPAEPVIEGPVDSIRWEMLRDGIEDYEYLVMLQRRIEARTARGKDTNLGAFRELLEVPDEIARDRTDFTQRPEPIEARRLRIARAIEQLKP